MPPVYVPPPQRPVHPLRRRRPASTLAPSMAAAAALPCQECACRCHARVKRLLRLATESRLPLLLLPWADPRPAATSGPIARRTAHDIVGLSVPATAAIHSCDSVSVSGRRRSPLLPRATGTGWSPSTSVSSSSSAALRSRVKTELCKKNV